MNVYQEFSRPLGDAAVAVGMFDGVHQGHRQVILRAAAWREQYRVAVLTFMAREHRPSRKADQKDILTPQDRLLCLGKLPVDDVYIPMFEQFCALSPEQFVRDILGKALSARVICCGEDYRFGRGAAGDVALLKRLADEIGAVVEVVPPVLDQGEPVSSTRIRRALTEADIETANRLLGYRYFIRGEVVYGRQIGRKLLDCATLNQELDSGICLPRFGVYISSTEIDGVEYPSITNIGVKPTIAGERQPLAETHVIGIDRDLYGQVLTVQLYRFLRGEQKFDGLEQLAAQMHRDMERSTEYFAQGSTD